MSHFESSCRISELKYHILSIVAAPPSIPSTANFRFATPRFSSPAGVAFGGPYDTSNPNQNRNNHSSNNDNARYPYLPRHRPVSLITGAPLFKSRPSFWNSSGAGISEGGHGMSVGVGAVGRNQGSGGGDGGGRSGLEEEDLEEDDSLDMNDDSDLDYPYDGPTRPHSHFIHKNPRTSNSPRAWTPFRLCSLSRQTQCSLMTSRRN